MQQSIDRYLALQLGGDRRAALALVDEGLAAGHSALDVMPDVVPEAPRRIGRLRDPDRIALAQERLATAVSQLVLAQRYPCAHAESRNGRKAPVAWATRARVTQADAILRIGRGKRG